MPVRSILNALVQAGAAVAIFAPCVSAAAPVPPSTPPPGSAAYHYVALDALPIPDGFSFLSTAVHVTNDRRIYGEIYKCGDESCEPPSIYVLKDGRFTILQQGTPNSVTENGVIGGYVFNDYDADIRQAAIFRGTKVQLIPRLPGETTSEVTSVSPFGSAVVRSTVRGDQGEIDSYYLYRPHQKNVPLPGGARINALGMLAGNVPGSRGYRWTFPGFGTPTILRPLSDDPQAQVWGINLRGDVLGYSYVDGGRERIGYWRGSTFKTLFTEGTSEFPTVSNRLAWNELGQVVVSGARNDFHPYLIPRAGVRLDLTTLVDRPLPTGNINFLTDINERGDILGSAVTGELYLLEALRR